MKHYLFLFILIFQTAFAQESEGHFTKHVSDAFKINTERLELYSTLSNGKSEIISRKLLRMEALLLPFAKLMDKEAKIYQEAGIPLLQIELMPMDLAPFKQKTITRYPLFFPLNTEKINDELKEVLETDNFILVADKAEEFIQKLEGEKGTHCLVRHFLESIRRSANYAPYHLAQAEEEGLKSPKKLIKNFIKLHLIGMKSAEKIDSLAFELQAQGLPILCQDVPFIPAW